MITQDDIYLDINIDESIDFSLDFTAYGEGSTPYDLTGAVIIGKIRQYPDGVLEYNFSCSHNNAGGQVTISMAHELTARLGFRYGWYDIKAVFPGGHTEELLHGKAMIIHNVSKLENDGYMYQVIAFENFDSFPIRGNVYRLYLDQETLTLYWWNSEQYVVIQNGIMGLAATIEVGTVSTGEPGTNASVVNAGTMHAAKFNFTIPRGNKGDQGDRGATGFITYPVFEMDTDTGDLNMIYDDDYFDGISFELSPEGDLILKVEVEA